MAFLVDTSILGRLANLTDPMYPVADRAVTELHRRGELLHLTLQNLIEFRNVATRPTTANGLGMTPAQAEAKAAGFEALGSHGRLDTIRRLPATVCHARRHGSQPGTMGG